jgi:hypothetical protein
MSRFSRNDYALHSFEAREWCKWFRSLCPAEREQALDGLRDMRCAGVRLTGYEEKALRAAEKIVSPH